MQVRHEHRACGFVHRVKKEAADRVYDCSVKIDPALGEESVCREKVICEKSSSKRD
jgi:hypothetical protein